MKKLFNVRLWGLQPIAGRPSYGWIGAQEGLTRSQIRELIDNPPKRTKRIEVTDPYGMPVTLSHFDEPLQFELWKDRNFAERKPMPGYAYVGDSLKSLIENLENGVLVDIECDGAEFLGVGDIDGHLYAFFQDGFRSYSAQLLSNVAFA